MSFTCTIIEGSGKYIYSIADKRMGIAKVLPGEEMGDYVFLNDDALKILKISNNIYMSGFGIVDTGERFLKELLPKSHLKPSEIIEHAKAICRKTPLGYDHKDYDGVRIFGIYDDGSLFVWQGNVDGSETLRFAIPGKAIILLGGGSKVVELENGTEYLRKALKEKTPKLQALVNTVDFMSSIDVQVSKTFDCVIISKDNKTTTECYDCIKEPTEVGVEYDQGTYVKILNAENDDLLVIDDDSADEGGYTTSLTPPKVVNVETGALQRNYLGIKNIAGINHYMYANIGPGISVGIGPTHVDGFSTLGRKYIKTTGSVEAGSPDGTQLSVMKKTGISTTGSFQADGLSSLFNVALNGYISPGVDLQGMNITLDVRTGGEQWYRMRWVKGILVSAVTV